MANLIVNNITLCIMAAIIIVCIAVMIIRTRKGLLVKAALYAVSKAEETWGSDTGRIKFAEVYTYLTKQYPVITFFFTEKQVSQIIEDALAQMKQILATKSSKEEKASENIVEH